MVSQVRLIKESFIYSTLSFYSMEFLFTISSVPMFCRFVLLYEYYSLAEKLIYLNSAHKYDWVGMKFTKVLSVTKCKKHCLVRFNECLFLYAFGESSFSKFFSVIYFWPNLLNMKLYNSLDRKFLEITPQSSYLYRHPQIVYYTDNKYR